MRKNSINKLLKKNNDNKTLLSYIVVIATKPLQFLNTQKAQIVDKKGSNVEEVKRKNFYSIKIIS